MGTFFGAIDGTKKSDRKKTSVTDYIILEYDKPIKIQLLTKPIQVYKHWIFTDGKKLPFNCSGYGCPICSRNLQILDEIGPEEAKKHPQFIERQQKFISNVVDLTSVKICPKCETVNDKVAAKCTGADCGNIIIDVEPQSLKSVRYLEGSYTMWEDLRQTVSLMPNVTDDTIIEVPFVIKKYKGNNDKVGYTWVPQIGDPDVVNPSDYKDNLFEKFGIQTSNEELTILMNGGSFREIVASRKDTIKDEVDSLFKD